MNYFDSDVIVQIRSILWWEGQ